MKKILLGITAIFSATFSMAQVPEDALRMTWNVPSGTARQQAIGGASGALGGDITSAFVNPAGMGVYKRGEFVISPGLSFISSKGNFLGENNKAGSSPKFHLGTTGVVWTSYDPYSKWANKTFSLAINRTANFNGEIFYKGVNDYSSYSESMANEFYHYYVGQREAYPGKSDEDIINDALNSNLSLLTKMGLYTYLVDIVNDGTSSTVISRAEEAGILNQEQRIVTSGGITEAAFSFAANNSDKFYLGGTIGLPIVNYSRKSYYAESDFHGTGNNEFSYSNYTEDFSSKGMGINAKLGIIARPVNNLRLGLAVHTPTLYALTDKFSATMETDIDAAPGSNKVFRVEASELLGGDNPEYKYDLITPWKFILSGALVLNPSENISEQRGFVSADIEYVSYKGSKFALPDADFSMEGFFDDLNATVKQIYKPAVNVRLGGEMKFQTFMTRLGFAYYGNPYKDAENLKARKMNISGGVGYRHKGMFVDLTYVHPLNKDVHVPYRVDPPRENVLANIKDSNGWAVLTVGFKF